MKKYQLIVSTLVLLAAIPLVISFKTIYNESILPEQRRKQNIAPLEFTTLEGEQGYSLEIYFKAGRRHNHPLMAFWIEDTTGKYIQSLYVANSIAKGYFGHGDASEGRWQAGPLRRPAALPYWGHKRGVKAPDGYYLPTPEQPLPDAITGATPPGNFILHTHTPHLEPTVFNILMEINQSWDWNQFWHNNKFPDDANYKTSSQPALVYMATIDVNNSNGEFEMKPIGYSHYSGANGSLNPDLSTHTTALQIADKVIVYLKR